MRAFRTWQSWSPALVLAAALPLAAQSKGSNGDLTVMPTRITLEGRDRSAEVLLRNTGRQPCAYRVYFQELRMLPSGEVEVVAKPDHGLAASDLVRFTPRHVLLPPGETQTVRIQLRKPENLADGEYRSHLVIEEEPPAEPPSPVTQTEDKAISLDIRTLVSISIPVIVRHGETQVQVALSDLRFSPGSGPGQAPALDLMMARKGNRSVQGEFTVDWLPRSGPPRTLLPVAGEVIYAEVDAHPTHLDLVDARGPELRGGRLRVTYAYRDIQQPPVVAFLDLP